MTVPQGDGSTVHDEGGVHARVLGIVRGREINADATLSLSGRSIVLAWEHAHAWRLDTDGLDGLMPGASQLTLYLSSGDVLELTGSETLRAFGRRVLDEACRMPELTRGLRAFGSERGAPGPAHDRWFAPLMAARRAAAGVSDAERQVELVNAAQISAKMERTLTELAKEQAPGHPAMQRAIEAALIEEAAPAFTALAGMTIAADALRGGALDSRLVDWRRWVTALREAFVAADSVWPKCAAVLVGGL
jgi:hypothetical protein